MNIENIPQSTEDLVALRNKVAITPEGGLACFIIALKHFAEGHPQGLEMLVITRAHEDLVTSTASGNYKGYTLGTNELYFTRNQLSKQPYLPMSYFNGATPQNNYVLNERQLSFSFSTNSYSGDIESGRIKVFVDCSGASSPRPATLVKNDKGIWKVKEYSSLIVGIQPKAAEKPSDDL